MHAHPVVGCSFGFLLLAWSPVVAPADPAGNDPELQALLEKDEGSPMFNYNTRLRTHHPLSAAGYVLPWLKQAGDPERL